jgi:hypothetical protein
MAIGGVVGYFLWKRKKSLDAKSETQPDNKNTWVADVKANVTPKPKPTSTTSSGGGGGTGGGVNTQVSLVNAPSTTMEVQKFQDWLDGKSLKWVGATNSSLTNGSFLNKGAGYGNFGISTTKAWQVYGKDYLKFTGQTSTSTGGSTPSSLREVIANKGNTPIWSNVNDLFPYRLADNGEKLGTTDGTIVKSNAGNPFYRLNYGGSTKYVAVENTI